MRRVAIGVVILVAGCVSHAAQTGVARWPEVKPGCRRVELYTEEDIPPFETRPLQEMSARWHDSNKNLRHWLINQACEAGAEAVVNVHESVDDNGQGQRVWSIRGVAVLFDRNQPSVNRPAHGTGKDKTESNGLVITRPGSGMGNGRFGP